MKNYFALARLFLVTSLVVPFCLSLQAADVPDNYRLIYQQDFESGNAAKDFMMSDTNAWQIGTHPRGKALELKAQSKYKPAVRSPFNIALIQEKMVGDFILEAELKQTGKEYGHRDMCLFFGFVNPTHFYYTHLATAADDHAHNIFIVNDAPRTKIASKTTMGVNWGLDIWHKVRLERKGKVIQVYFDDLTTPVMTAENDTFKEGYIGFGSFDDTGMVDNVKVWAPSVKTKGGNIFSEPAKP